MKTIVEAFEYNCTHKSDETFCHFLKAGQVEQITYLKLYRESGRYANFYQKQGLLSGQVVLIILNHTTDLYYAFIGAMLAGLVPSFMPPPTSKQDPALYWSSHQELFKRIGAGALLTYTDHVGLLNQKLPDLPLQIMTTQDVQTCSDRFTVTDINSKNIAFLQHSSGTTGLKKGVALSHDAVLNQVASYGESLNITERDRIVSWLPLYHDMGLIACFMLPLISGISIVQIDPFEWVTNPKMLFEAITTYQSTLCWMPNFAFHHLYRTVRQKSDWKLKSIRAWINCSEPAKAETTDFFVQKFTDSGVSDNQLKVCYAMAETVFAVTQTPLDRPVKIRELDNEQLRTNHRAVPPTNGQGSTTYLSTGQPISSLEYKIVNALGETLDDNHIGEVAIAGKCLFSGYYHQDEHTQKKLHDGWYYTGDLGFKDDGELYITGRQDDMIIVHGRNYYAHELEYIVNQISGVKPGRCVAAGCFQDLVGTDEAIIIAETNSPEIEEDHLILTIKQQLLDSSGLLPYDVRLVHPGWLVKTTSGKISRQANLEKYLAEMTAVTT